MDTTQNAREILEIMMRHLGFQVKIETGDDPDHPYLHIRTHDSVGLIGKRGERLNDIQHLVNKILRQKFPDSRRVRVDVEHFRSRQSSRFLDDVKKTAEKVKQSGQPAKLEPMNSYERRLVHNFFMNDPDIRVWSPEDAGRMKRITLLPQKKAGEE